MDTILLAIFASFEKIVLLYFLELHCPFKKYHKQLNIILQSNKKDELPFIYKNVVIQFVGVSN